MTQLGEGVAVGIIIPPDPTGNNCPFCGKAKHDFPSKQQAASTKVVSKPKDLKCKHLPVKGSWPHTTAAHHLISAKQCYAKVRRLVRMASMVGYDINNPNNGISLPTVANNIAYSLGSAAPKKYGKFGEAEKRRIAFSVMRQSSAQWHVGHHAVKVEIPEDWADEADNSFVGHTVSYDESVIKELLALTGAWVAEDWCKKEEDKSSNIKKDLDAVSDLIKGKLNSFGTGSPRASTPFFVSQMARDYADATPAPAEEVVDDDIEEGPKLKGR